MAAINPTSKIKCKQCNNEYFIDLMLNVGGSCNVKKCWLRKDKAFRQAAEIANCTMRDFYVPSSGKTEVHKTEKQSIIVTDTDDSFYEVNGYC